MIETKLTELEPGTIPAGTYPAVIASVFPRTVTYREESRHRLAVDVRIDAGEHGVHVLPLWLAPVVLPAGEKSRPSALYRLLASANLLTSLEDAFPGRDAWETQEAFEALAAWLSRELCDRRGTADVRVTRRASGEPYSLVDGFHLDK